LYVSSNHYPYKNLIKLFEAYRSLHLHYKLVVVGKTVPRFTPAVHAKISELGLGEKIVLLENLTSEKMLSIYKFADLFVYPSLYEGFGIPPLEAMFHNIPVVASETSSIPEVCGDAAVYINPHSVESIANGITKGLNDNDLRQKLQVLGQQRVSMFSWEKTAKGILEGCQIVLQ
jgi:glycosyltransferase involved in cell wall biosynthesis